VLIRRKRTPRPASCAFPGPMEFFQVHCRQAWAGVLAQWPNRAAPDPVSASGESHADGPTMNGPLILLVGPLPREARAATAWKASALTAYRPTGCPA